MNMKRIIIWSVIFILFAISCSPNEQTTSEYINIVTQTEQVTLIENFEGTGFDCSIDNGGMTRSGESNMYLITASNNRSSAQILIDVAPFKPNTIQYVDYYSPEGDYIGTVGYNSEGIMVSIETGEIVLSGVRRDGEGYWDCVDRVWKTLADHVENNSGVANRIAYKALEPIWDALFISMGLACCGSSEISSACDGNELLK